MISFTHIHCYSRFAVQRTVNSSVINTSPTSSSSSFWLLDGKYSHEMLRISIQPSNRYNKQAKTFFGALYWESTVCTRARVCGVCESALHLCFQKTICAHIWRWHVAFVGFGATRWIGDRRWMPLMTTVKLCSLWKLAVYVFPYLTKCIYEREPHYPLLRAGSYYYNTYFIQIRCMRKKKGGKENKERTK